MNWIFELTCAQWTYVLTNVASIIGLLYAACSSMFMSDKSILMKSYNTLPSMKVYGMNEEKVVILNFPGDIVFEVLQENTSLFLGFLVSAMGFVLDTLLVTEELGAKYLLILAIPISVICYLILYFLSKVIAYVRLLIIIDKIKKNKIMPLTYHVFETDNVDDKKGYIGSKLYTKSCSWERKIVDGNVQDKNE